MESKTSDVKKQIHALKAEIAETIGAKDHVKLKKLRRQVKRLKSQTRKIASAKTPSSAPVAESPPSVA